jgi:hypothetical protein
MLDEAGTQNRSLFRRLIRKALLVLMTAVGTAAGALAFGVMDYLYDPEYFRPGKKPEPSNETAPGEAEVTPSLIRSAEGRRTVTLTFRCGQGGISEGGGIKVGLCRQVDFGEKGRRAAFLYANGWGPIQNRHSRLGNYYTCDVHTSGRARLKVIPQGYFPLRGALRYLGREALRRSGVKLDPLDVIYLFMEQRKIRIRVIDDRLQEGDEIIVTLGDTRRGSRGWASPVHASRTDLVVEVDEKAMGEYRPITPCPVLEVVGGEASALEAVLSSMPVAGEGRLVLRAVDSKGELDATFTGQVELYPTPGLEIVSRAEFGEDDRGVLNIPCRADTAGIHHVRVTACGISGESNPVSVGGDFRLFWGDIHTHSVLCDGCLEPSEFYRMARDGLGLDFAAITTHDNMEMFEPSGREDEWQLLRELREKFNQPGRFVTFLGYEWSEHKQGHRGVYYAPDEPDPRIYSCLDPESDTPLKLEEKLRNQEVIVIPHHTAWRRIFLALFNWFKFIRMKVPEAYTWWGSENEQQRLMEIYSMHGSSERYDGPYPITHGKPRGWFPRFLRDDRGKPGHGNYVQEALASGLRLGVIAGSDRHDYALDERFHPIDIYTAGLTAIWADELTDASLWRSLWNRRVYGTTGARIIVELFADGLPMGSEYFCTSHPRLTGGVTGTAALRLVELLRHDDRGYGIAWSLSGRGEHEATFDFVDRDIQGEAFYYLRVEQEDGHLAWSSPIWIIR